MSRGSAQFVCFLIRAGARTDVGICRPIVYKGEADPTTLIPHFPSTAGFVPRVQSTPTPWGRSSSLADSEPPLLGLLSMISVVSLPSQDAWGGSRASRIVLLPSRARGGGSNIQTWAQGRMAMRLHLIPFFSPDKPNHNPIFCLCTALSTLCHRTTNMQSLHAESTRIQQTDDRKLVHWWTSMWCMASLTESICLCIDALYAQVSSNKRNRYHAPQVSRLNSLDQLRSKLMGRGLRISSYPRIGALRLHQVCSQSREQARYSDLETLGKEHSTDTANK